MGYGISKRGNDYAGLVFDVEAPKTVWMAIAVSFAVRNGCALSEADLNKAMLDEWRVLNQNGIVPQKPRLRVRGS